MNVELFCDSPKNHLNVFALERKDRTDLQMAFVRYLLSRKGQTAAQEEGFFPLSAETAAEQLQAALQTPDLDW